MPGRFIPLATVILNLLLSIFSVGGLPSVMPEMQRIVVESQAWATPLEFVQLFAIAQAVVDPSKPAPIVSIVSVSEARASRAAIVRARR